MRAGAVVFRHETVADLAREHLFRGATDDVHFAVLGAAQHDLDVHFVPFERDFGRDGMLEGLGKCIWPVEDAAVIDVSDAHRHLLALCFTIRGLDRNTALACDAADGDLCKSLEESIVETTAVLRTNRAGKDGSGGVGCALSLQPTHVCTEGGEHVTCRRVVHRKPLASAFVLHRTVLLRQVVHHGIRRRCRRIVRDGGSTCSERIRTWHTRAAHAARQGRAGVRLRHVRPAERTHRCTRTSRPGLESLLWHTLWRQALLGHALWRKALLGHALWREALLRHALLWHLAVARHHALLGHALRRKALLRVALGAALLRETSHRRPSHVGLSGRRLPRNTGGTTALTCATFRAKHGVIRNGFSTRCALHGATSSLLRRPAS